MINIVNKHRHPPTMFDYYIGRGSVLGNPYSHLKESKAITVVESREKAIEEYENWLLTEIKNKNKAILKALHKIKKMHLQGNVTNKI
jgi:demethoxyubiquinone hydroxylase (CLK1/Coq7/Cat5 family)